MGSGDWLGITKCEQSHQRFGAPGASHRDSSTVEYTNSHEDENPQSDTDANVHRDQDEHADEYADPTGLRDARSDSNDRVFGGPIR